MTTLLLSHPVDPSTLPPAGEPVSRGHVPGIVAAGYRRLVSEGSPCADVDLQLHTRIDKVNSSVQVFRATADDCPGIVMKSYRCYDGEGKPAVAEYSSLEQLRGVFADRSDLDVPRPLEVSSDGRTLVMEEMEGQQLDEVLSAASWNAVLKGSRSDAVDVAIRACVLAAEWLSEFQNIPRCDGDATVERRQPVASELLVQRLDSALARLRREAPRLADTLPRVEAYFRERVSRLPDVCSVPHHPDFGPYNVLVSGGRVVVLDLAETSRGHAFEAPAFFWASLEIRSLLPWARTSILRRCQEAFWQSYAQADEPTTFWSRWGLLLYVSYLRPRPSISATAEEADWFSRTVRRKVADYSRGRAIERLRSEDWSRCHEYS